MEYIDLRSDTVTWPTPAMREAMAAAPVGDDVYGEDPTINRLEALAAERFGKAAGLFVASGTMGNVVSILATCQRGDEIITGNSSHIFLNEAGNPAVLGGVHTWPVPVEADGTLSLDAIEAAIRADDQHYPRTRLVCLENTHASSGGQPLPLSYVDAVGELCRKHDLALHIDGARIFNAAVATGVDVARLTQAATSVTFCLSKGLCAPVGSVIVGDEAFIQQARRIRKALGGGMRQAGIVAAAGIVALDEMTSRLAEDHANACRLAKGLATIPAIEINVGAVKTNILYFNLRDDAPRSPAELADELKTDGILIKGAYHQRRFRLVTHFWIKSSHVDLVVDRMRSLLE